MGAYSPLSNLSTPLISPRVVCLWFSFPTGMVSLPPSTAENKPGFPSLRPGPGPGPSPAENNWVPGPGSPSLILCCAPSPLSGPLFSPVNRFILSGKKNSDNYMKPMQTLKSVLFRRVKTTLGSSFRFIIVSARLSGIPPPSSRLWGATQKKKKRKKKEKRAHKR